MKNNLIITAFLLSIFLAACNLPAFHAPAPLPGLPTVSPPATIEPLPVANEFLSDVTVVSYDPFDNLLNWNIHNDSGTLVNGELQLRGTPRWQSSFWPKQQFTEGQGLAIRFMVQKANAQSEFVFVTGDWRTDSFRQFGVYNAVDPKGDLFQGMQNLGGYDLTSSLTLLSNTWYDLLLAIGHNGHFLAVVWDPNHEDQRAVYDLVGGANWAGRSWVFLPKANQGETIVVDDFYRLSFGDIK